MKIVTNDTGHAVFVGGVALVPGTNTLPDSFDASRLKAFVARGAVRVEDSGSMDAAAKAAALAGANTEAELDKAEAALGATDDTRREEIAAESGRPSKRKRKG